VLEKRATLARSRPAMKEKFYRSAFRYFSFTRRWLGLVACAAARDVAGRSRSCRSSLNFIGICL
jgi:hypothetical protein